MKLNELTIVEAIKGLKEKKFSAVELTQACLDRIKEVDNKIKAFITACEKEALEQAKKTDKLIKTNPQCFKEKPLLGIPIGIKDLYLTNGIKTTAGSKVLEDYIPQYDATTVKRLKKAGIVIIGKTNLDAWGHGSSGENSDFFATRNPWNLDYVPGGSSSGSGAAVSSGECLGATGTDTGSSIRLPASFCNLTGLKPTYGRVSRYGIVAMASSLDSPGCITKTVEDHALMFGVMAGNDIFDATTPKVKVLDYIKSLRSLKKNLKGLKIGIPKEYFIKGIDNSVKSAVKKAIEEFKNFGAKITDISLPHTKYSIPTYYILVSSEISSNLARYDGIRYGFNRKRFGDEAKRRIMLGTYSLSAGYYDAFYLKAQKVRTLIKNDFEKAFKKVDVLIAPTSPMPPFRIGEKVNNPLTMYLSDILLCPINLAGVPALNIPCGFTQHHFANKNSAGFTKNNLPIGMQIIGPQFSEELLFKVGHAYQQITDWHKKRPKI